MQMHSPTLLPPVAPTGPITTLNLDEATAVQLACALAPGAQPGSQLHIDCSRLACQRTLGVSHVVSQLLLLRRTGADIWLRNVNGPLRRCLQLLQLSCLFHFV